ncbi:uncharacterized protein Triagg1_6382 [Trichoderma aggressivum f. europaeum]|uniref:C2H2-type domain-containing protein n=1 Tax=Trichoderma aggressivum f. europaeum TaxID=173218 RepID=A0AAE1J482_9HYPO|nr:hypothetical protein Triagg1_6382 [Trichoderma aggressivum f. europaeum]
MRARRCPGPIQQGTAITDSLMPKPQTHPSGSPSCCWKGEVVVMGYNGWFKDMGKPDNKSSALLTAEALRHSVDAIPRLTQRSQLTRTVFPQAIMDVKVPFNGPVHIKRNYRRAKHGISIEEVTVLRVIVIERMKDWRQCIRLSRQKLTSAVSLRLLLTTNPRQVAARSARSTRLTTGSATNATRTFRAERPLTSTDSKHPSPYVCVFHYANCNTRFDAKKKWKCHVSTRHLSLEYWVCAEGMCADERQSSHQRYAGPATPYHAAGHCDPGTLSQRAGWASNVRILPFSTTR